MNKHSAGPDWRQARENDLPAICAIGSTIHVALPERPDVTAEKLSLFPQGCFVFETGGAVFGYAVSHPWTLGAPPKLDSFLDRLPETADCLFIHDVAILPQARGRKAAERFLDRALTVAAQRRLRRLELISVYGASALWGRCGFAPAPCATPLGSYGPDALYMARRIGV
jgi:GNAT superfamily N-acetyltransferase